MLWRASSPRLVRLTPSDVRTSARDEPKNARLLSQHLRLERNGWNSSVNVDMLRVPRSLPSLPPRFTASADGRAVYRAAIFPRYFNGRWHIQVGLERRESHRKWFHVSVSGRGWGRVGVGVGVGVVGGWGGEKCRSASAVT